MSIYSGFATRQQQQTYDHCLNSLLYILQKRILKFYTNEKTDEYKFSSLIQKLYLQMKHQEKSKYLDPKCSYAIQELFEYLIKQNYTENNATVQNDSNAQQQNLKNQVYKKRPADLKSIEGSIYNEAYGKQKTYQIPIRTEKSSPDKTKTRTSGNGLQNIGKIISSKSKEKQPRATIQHSSNAIRKRTPSTSQGSRLIQNKIVSSNQQESSFNRSRNMSFNEGGIKYKPFSKSSARFQIQSDFQQEHEINQIIQGYIEKTKRNRISSQQNSRSKLNKSIQNQPPYFTNKR